MNLLLINFVMDPNSQVLSWQVKVAFALAPHFNQIVVLTHRQQNIDGIPSNVRIIEFPFLARAPFRWFGGEYLLNFWVWHLHRNYRFDHCFMHMNYRWAYRLAPFFKLSGIPVSIWYAHKEVTKWLKLAHYFANKVITSTPKGFRIQSDKAVYIGQGIDTEIFNINKPNVFSSNILYVGRISRSKRIKALIQVLALLINNEQSPAFTLTVIGAPLNDDDKLYYKSLQQLILKERLSDHVIFAGAVKHHDIPNYYANSFLHLSFSDTGSMDKSLLESLSAGCPVLTSNPSLFDILGDKYKIMRDDYNTVANQVLAIYYEQLSIDRQVLRNKVVNHHSFDGFVIKLRDQIL